MGCLQFFSCMHFLEGEHVTPQQRLLKASREVQKMSFFCGEWLLVGIWGNKSTFVGNKLQPSLGQSDTKELLGII